MFTQQALAGKAQLIPDPANTFISQVCNALGAIVPIGLVGATVQNATGLMHFDFEFPTGAVTATFTATTPDKIQIVDVICRKAAAGAGNTLQIKDGAANAISDAIVFAALNTVTRAGTLDPAFATIAAGANFTVVNTFAAGSIAGNVTVVARRV
jgi:hypothetical protein